jgi:putative endonuclease
MLRSLGALADRVRDAGRKRVWEPDQARGRRGEDLAHRYLQEHGFTVVARNWRTGSGDAEVDIVAWEGDMLVFVEVKSRTSSEHGPPDRAISAEKQRHLRYAARAYSARAQVDWEQVRFDVVSVILSSPPEITHFRDLPRRPR